MNQNIWKYGILFIIGLTLSGFTLYKGIQLELITGAGIQFGLLILLFFFCILPTLISIWRGTFDLFEPIIIYTLFVAMNGLVIVDRVYFQGGYVSHQDIITMDASTALLLATSLYVMFTGGVLIGYYFNITRWVSVPQMEIHESGFDTGLMKRISYLYQIVGMIFFVLLVLIALDGDLFRMFDGTTPRSEIFAGLGFFQLGVDLLPLGYLIWLAALVNENKRLKFWWLLPLFPIVFMLFLLGGRSDALSIVVATIIFLYYSILFGMQNLQMKWITFPKDKLHSNLKLSIIPLIGAIFGVVVIVTGRLRQGAELSAALDEIDIMQILTAGTHDGTLDALIVTVESVPDDFGYHWGTLIFRVPLNWIPRALWNDKPVLTSGSLLRREVWPGAAGGRPPGEIGRFYIDLGLPGVIIGAILSGIVLRYAYTLLKENGTSPIFLLIYSWLFFSVAKSPLANGTLWNVMSSLVLLAPLLLIYRKYRGPKTS